MIIDLFLYMCLNVSIVLHLWNLFTCFYFIYLFKSFIWLLIFFKSRFLESFLLLVFQNSSSFSWSCVVGLQKFCRYIHKHTHVLYTYSYLHYICMHICIYTYAYQSCVWVYVVWCVSWICGDGYIIFWLKFSMIPSLSVCFFYLFIHLFLRHGLIALSWQAWNWHTDQIVLKLTEIPLFLLLEYWD